MTKEKRESIYKTLVTVWCEQKGLIPGQIEIIKKKNAPAERQLQQAHSK